MPAPPAGDSVLVGVVGHPISHSLSPAMHNAAFAVLLMRWHYAAFDVLTQDFAKAISGARVLGMRGLNVTSLTSSSCSATIRFSAPPKNPPGIWRPFPAPAR